MPRTKIRSRGTRKAIPQLEVMNPGKGLNVFVSENFINDAEASSLQNVETVEVGAITKRRGISAVGTGLVNAPKGLGSYVTSTVRQLLTVDGTALKYLNGTSWTSYAGGIVFTASQNTSFTQCAGYMFVHNGTDAATKLDGTTATRPGTTVSSSFGIYYHDRQFASGVATQPNRLYISSPTNVDDFTNAVDTATTHPGSTAYLGTDAKFVDIALNDGDKITALGKFQDLLIIFKERSIWSLELDSAGVPIVKLVQAGVGCVSHRGIDNVDNDLFFPTRRGYGVLGNEPNYFNAVRTNELSQRITPLYQQVTPANLSSIVSIYSDYIFLLSRSLWWYHYQQHDAEPMTSGIWAGVSTSASTPTPLLSSSMPTTSSTSITPMLRWLRSMNWWPLSTTIMARPSMPTGSQRLRPWRPGALQALHRHLAHLPPTVRLGLGHGLYRRGYAREVHDHY
jgi:hypothetical protein